MAALLVADMGLFEENTISPIRKRSPEEQAEVYIRYQLTVLTEAGGKVSEEPDILRQIIKRPQQLSQRMSFTLFDDVLTTLKMLKEQNLTLNFANWRHRIYSTLDYFRVSSTIVTPSPPSP